jgi:DNA-binding NarL/FixJ family response regulator
VAGEDTGTCIHIGAKTQAPQPTRVLLVEDHDLVRAGIRSLLGNMRDVHVVAEAGNAEDALELIEQYRPHVVLMDIALPGMNGLAATTRVTEQFAGVRVIILSMHVNDLYVSQALQAGALGYILKNASFTELEQAIRTVAGGEAYLSPPVSKHLAMDYIRRAKGEPSSLEQLTPRQREVLKLIAEGRTTQQMADRLNVSVKTIESHRSQLMERLDIYDVAGLVRYAIHMGLIMPDS